MPRPAAPAPPLIIAHRGASFDAPENTLAAFGLALDQDADGLEGDFRLTRDGQVVCVHDATTGRTAGVDLVCSESTLEQLRQLDAGAWKGTSWGPQHIPTLEEVLAITPPGKRLHLEIKCGPEILPAIGRTLRAAHRPPADVALMSFDEAVIAEAKQQLPELATYWLVAFDDEQSLERPAPSAQTIVETARRLRADGVGCQDHAAFDPAFAAALRQAGLELHVWTVNDAPAVRRYVALGARSLTTDRPGIIRDWIHRSPW